jgi:hypothetical protein
VKGVLPAVLFQQFNKRAKHMKAHLFFAALSISILSVACHKNAPLLPAVSDDTLELSLDERCGCLPPVKFDIEKVTAVSASISWNTMPESVGYEIEIIGLEYKSSSDEFSEARSYATANNQIYLTGLTPNTTYKYRVQTVCRNAESDFSEIMQFDTKERQVRQPHLPGQVNSQSSNL